MRHGRLLGIIVAGLVLTGCKSSSPGEVQRILGRDLFVDSAALAAFYPHDVTLTEAAAKMLRTLDPRYTVQKAKWMFPSRPKKVYSSDPLAHANIDYAHAAGLTGAGETIALVDEGFLTTHQEFTGKVISVPDAPHAPGVADHGTSVASIAAGSGVGDMIGVAPGANLVFGSFKTLGHMTAATILAKDEGAIVQNNSWGFEGNPRASNKNYEISFGSVAGRAYIDSLRDFSQNGVIVFAASNQRLQHSDLTSALPMLLPELERSWITVINAVPTYSGGEISKAALLSSRCLEAAAWCMAADGTFTAATGSGDADYDFVTGTSMAAPMVSGAVALLAEAFPTLTAQELRARLLASADNSFYKHTGYVAFAPDLQHGFDETFGHGFLDMRAALMPIGGSFMPIGRGKRVRVDRPIVLSGGMAGNALSRRLADHDIAVVDGLGAGFNGSASILAADAVQSSGRDTALELLTGIAGDPMQNVFPTYIEGQQLDLSVGDTRIALLLPSDGTARNIGISVLRDFNDDLPGVSLGLTAMQEADSYVGIRSLVDGTRLGGSHVAATLGLELPFSDSHGLRLTGTVGVAMPQGNMPAMEMSTVNFNAIGMSYGGRDVMSAGDRISIGVSLPQVVHSGVASVALPTTRSIRSAQQPRALDVPLAPEQRQMDLTFSYAVPVSRNSEVSFSAVRSLNEDHFAGRSATGAGIGFSLRF